MMLRGKKWKYSSAPLTEFILEERKWEKIWRITEQISAAIIVLGIGFGFGFWYAVNMPLW